MSIFVIILSNLQNNGGNIHSTRFYSVLVEILDPENMGKDTLFVKFE